MPKQYIEDYYSRPEARQQIMDWLAHPERLSMTLGSMGDPRNAGNGQSQMQQFAGTDWGRLLAAAKQYGIDSPQYQALLPEANANALYGQQHDTGVVGAFGNIARVVAPFAGAVLPVGLLASAAIGAGGNSLGQLAATGKINPVESILAGGASVGGHLIGGAVSGGAATGAGAGAGAGGGAGTFGTAGMPGAVSSALPALPAAPAAFGGVTPTGQVLPPGGALPKPPGLPGLPGGSGVPTAVNAGSKIGDTLINKVIPGVLAGGSAINAANQQSQADDYRKRAIALAEQQYADRKPLRDKALTLASGPLPTVPDLSSAFAPRGKASPYARMPAPPPPGSY